MHTVYTVCTAYNAYRQHIVHNICIDCIADASQGLPQEVLAARPIGRRPRGRPRTRWVDYISMLAWERLGIAQKEVANVALEREDWGSVLENVAPHDPTLDK